MGNFGKTSNGARLEMNPLIEEAVRLAADEPFSKARIDVNEQVIDQRIREMEDLRTLPFGNRRLRTALVFSLVAVLVSVGASALFVYHVSNTDVDSAQHVTPHKTEQDNRHVQKALPVQDVKPAIPPSMNEKKMTPRQSNNRTPQSVLQRQLSLFEAAKGLSKQGKCAMALTKLDRLDGKYPNGFFKLESKELRARCLARMTQLGSAAVLVGELIKQTSSHRKKAVLLRFLGDIEAKQGQCDAAIKSYRRALGLGLLKTDEKAARAGIVACSK